MIEARTVFLTLALTGLRKSELQGLRWRIGKLLDAALRVETSRTAEGERLESRISPGLAEHTRATIHPTRSRRTATTSSNEPHPLYERGARSQWGPVREHGYVRASPRVRPFSMEAEPHAAARTSAEIMAADGEDAVFRSSAARAVSSLARRFPFRHRAPGKPNTPSSSGADGSLGQDTVESDPLCLMTHLRVRAPTAA